MASARCTNSGRELVTIMMLTFGHDGATAEASGKETPARSLGVGEADVHASVSATSVWKYDENICSGGAGA